MLESLFGRGAFAVKEISIRMQSKAKPISQSFQLVYKSQSCWLRSLEAILQHQHLNTIVDNLQKDIDLEQKPHV